MGSSLLTMPWGMENAGLLMGIITIVVMGGLCLYTTHKILQVQMQHGKLNSSLPILMKVTFDAVCVLSRSAVEVTTRKQSY